MTRYNECHEEDRPRLVTRPETSPSPAALTSFDMAFYSALLAQRRRGKSLIEPVSESFDLADAHHRAIHATGTPFAKFKLALL